MGDGRWALGDGTRETVERGRWTVDERPTLGAIFRDSVNTRHFLARLMIGAALVAAPLGVRAQEKPVDPARQLRSLQEQLDLTRKQRLELEARLERELAAEIAQRAQMLAMGGEMGALQRLEQLLDSAQGRLLVQRDRIRLLDDAARTPGVSVLVILLRMDQTPPGEVGTAMMIDGQPAGTRTIGAEQLRTLAAGAAEQMYRGEVPPSGHRVALQVVGKGLNGGATIEVPPAPKQITYVEFTVRNGVLLTATWTSGASAP